MRVRPSLLAFSLAMLSSASLRIQGLSLQGPVWYEWALWDFLSGPFALTHMLLYLSQKLLGSFPRVFVLT